MTEEVPPLLARAPLLPTSAEIQSIPSPSTLPLIPRKSSRIPAHLFQSLHKATFIAPRIKMTTLIITSHLSVASQPGRKPQWPVRATLLWAIQTFTTKLQPRLPRTQTWVAPGNT